MGRTRLRYSSRPLTAHDARGNTVAFPQPSDLTAAYSAAYDAWNRLVEVKDGSNVVLKCEYDGLGRRTKKFVNTSDPLDQTYDAYRHFFYNSGWQILETRRSESENDPPESENPEVQYVWSERYIDAPVLRDRDADEDAQTGDLGVTDSGLEERLYYTTDANMNVTALLDTGGDAVERYVYNPYGEVTIYDDDWSDTRSSSSYANAILYCGYYHDTETGLYHVRHRMYHPRLGRWAQRDPASVIGVAEFPAQVPDVFWRERLAMEKSVSRRFGRLSARARSLVLEYSDGPNLYCYAEDNPIVGRDYTGWVNRPHSGDKCCLVYHDPVWKLLGYESARECAIDLIQQAWVDLAGSKTGAGELGLVLGVVGVAVPPVGAGLGLGAGVEWGEAYVTCNHQSCREWGIWVGAQCCPKNEETVEEAEKRREQEQKEWDEAAPVWPYPFRM